MTLTKAMLDAKLKQVAQFEEQYGECTRSRAMKKYCTSEVYRKNVDTFNKSIQQTINAQSWRAKFKTNENEHNEF